MCIIFAVCFILRGRDTHIDFLQFISGRHDFGSDVSQEHFLKRKLLHCNNNNNNIFYLNTVGFKANIAYGAV